MVGGMWLRRVARGVSNVVWDWAISRVGLCVFGSGVGGAGVGKGQWALALRWGALSGHMGGHVGIRRGGRRDR